VSAPGGTGQQACPVLEFTVRPGGAPDPHLLHGGPAQVRAAAGGAPVTVLRSAADVTAVLAGRDWGMAGVTENGELTRCPFTGAERQSSDGGLLNMDPPKHRRYRSRINPLFTTAAAEQSRAAVVVAATEQASALKGRASADLVADYCEPLIARLVCESLGLPARDWPLILKASANAFMPVRSGQLDEVDAGWVEIYRYYDQVATAGYASPGGIVARIMDALPDSEGFTHQQRVHLLANVSNGYPAALQSLVRCTWELLADPAALEARKTGSATWEGITAGLLDTKALFSVDLPRRALRGTRVGDTWYDAGTVVLPSLIAAASDPSAAGPPPGIAFSFGPHRCPGAALTLLWLSAALEILFGHFPDAELADRTPAWAGGSLSAPERIMVTLRPGRQATAAPGGRCELAARTRTATWRPGAL
jgi:cytochrome P450